MFLDEIFQAILSAPDSNDFGSLVDEFVGHSSTNARGRADEEHSLVLKHHFEVVSTLLGLTNILLDVN